MACLTLHLGHLLEDTELGVAANEQSRAHARDVIVRRERRLLDAAEALALALAKNCRGLHGVLAAEQAQLAPVAVTSGAARAIRRGTNLQAALVLCYRP